MIHVMIASESAPSARMAARSTTARPVDQSVTGALPPRGWPRRSRTRPHACSLRTRCPPRPVALGVFGVEQRPADAFDELRCDVGIADIRRRHALLQLEGTAIVAERGGLVRRSVGH